MSYSDVIRSAQHIMLLLMLLSDDGGRLHLGGKTVRVYLTCFVRFLIIRNTLNGIQILIQQMNKEIKIKLEPIYV